MKAEYHNEFNPELWDGEKLKPAVLTQLRIIVKTFLDYCNVDCKPEQINLVGSQANYTWSDESDIDICVVCDMGENKDLLTKFFDAKKKIFKRDHDIKIYGLPIEITVIDKSDQSNGLEGIYSLMMNSWIHKPEYKEPEYDPSEADWIADHWKDKIKKAIKNQDAEEMDAVRKQIKDTRKNGLESDGEDAEENIAYKELRRGGYIDKLKSVQRKKLAQNLSLKEHVEVNCPAGFFVKVLPTTECNSLIYSYFNGLRPMMQDLHATILYTTQPTLNAMLPKISKKERYTAIAKHLEFWSGEEGNIVLTLESSDLVFLHDLFSESGLKHNFPDFVPHLTLVHPCIQSEYSYWIQEYNKRLSENPLVLEFYYGGYVIMENKT